MERIGIYDARAKLSELIERVQFGEEVVLTRHGEPVARLVPEKSRRKGSGTATVARIRALARKLNIRGVDVRKLIEEGRRYDAAYFELAMRLKLPLAAKVAPLVEAARKAGVILA